jgi:hypothetical protein
MNRLRRHSAFVSEPGLDSGPDIKTNQYKISVVARTEGPGFSQANNDQAKGLYLAAAGRSEGAASTTELPSLVPAKQIAISTSLSLVIPMQPGPYEGKQFSRCGCASTPACGSEVLICNTAFVAWLKPCPSGLSLSKPFAQFICTPGSWMTRSKILTWLKNTPPNKTPLCMTTALHEAGV